MSSLKTGLLIGGALLAYNALTKGAALAQLNFYPGKVTGIKFDGSTPVLSFILTVQNTSNQNIVLRSIAGNLFANGYLIGNVASFIPVNIGPNSQTNLFLTVRLSLIGVVTDVINALNNTGLGLHQVIELQSTANVDRYQIPVNISYKIGN